MRVLSTELLADQIDAPGEEGQRARALGNANIQASKHAEFHALDLVLDLGCEASPVVAVNSETQPESRGALARLPACPIVGSRQAGHFATSWGRG